MQLFFMENNSKFAQMSSNQRATELLEILVILGLQCDIMVGGCTHRRISCKLLWGEISTLFGQKILH